MAWYVHEKEVAGCTFWQLLSFLFFTMRDSLDEDDEDDSSSSVREENEQKLTDQEPRDLIQAHPEYVLECLAEKVLTRF